MIGGSRAGQGQCHISEDSNKTNLNTVTPVDLHVAGIVLPDNTELQDTLGNLRDSESLLVLRVPLEERSEGGRDLVEGLHSAKDNE